MSRAVKPDDSVPNNRFMDEALALATGIGAVVAGVFLMIGAALVLR